MADAAISETIVPSLEEIQTMKVTDLRKKLKALGLSITGNKTELIERLQEACLKGNDSFENSQLSFDESQISELENTEDSAGIEDSALLDQDQFSSYISSSLEDDTKVLESAENKLTVTMPLKKRTLTNTGVVGTVEKKMSLNRSNVAHIDFDIKQNQQSKPVISSTSDKIDSEEKVVLSVKNMSAAERMAMRAKRFNMSSTGVTTNSSKSTNNRNSKQSILSSATTPDLDVLKKRAERFGQSVSTVMKQIEQKEKLLKRKCKFGTSLSISSTSSLDEKEKKRKRAERFAIS